MKDIKYTKISMEDYKEIESSIDSITNEEELIEIHKSLVNKTCKNDNYEIKDCGVEFLKKLFSRNWGRTIVYKYSKGAQSFFKSEYLSNYFKSSIKELLSIEELNEEVFNILDSEKLINDMSEEEIEKISFAIKQHYYNSKEQEKVNIASSFMSLLYKLDGEGVISYIKNNVDDRELASHILLTSGLNDRASYYSGRGVNYSDLNENNLIAIYESLLKLDSEYANNFIKIVNNMKTLGATEFINTFMNFASHNFNAENLIAEESNISLDGLNDMSRDVIGAISIFSTFKRSEDYDRIQIINTEQIKRSFMTKIKEKTNIDFNFHEEESYVPKYVNE